jgi:DNA-binding transcriptional LysR family regulator
MSKITLRQLQALSAVISAGTVNKAAVNMAISQPALSQLISNMEYVSGLRLFIRENRRLVPTEEAYLLHDFAQEIFTGLSSLDKIAGDIRNRVEGKVVLASTPAVALLFVMRALAPYLRDKPNLEASFLTARPQTIYNWVARRSCDFGVSVGDPGNNSQVDTLHSVQIPLVCVLPLDHRLGELEVITAKDLKNERILLFSSPSPLRNKIEMHFADQNVPVQQQVDASVGDSLCVLASQGLGIGLVNPFAGEEYQRRNEVVTRPFHPVQSFELTICVPHNKPISLIAQDMIAILVETLEKYCVPK